MDWLPTVPSSAAGSCCWCTASSLCTSDTSLSSSKNPLSPWAWTPIFSTIHNGTTATTIGQFAENYQRKKKKGKKIAKWMDRRWGGQLRSSEVTVSTPHCQWRQWSWCVDCNLFQWCIHPRTHWHTRRDAHTDTYTHGTCYGGNKHAKEHVLGPMDSLYTHSLCRPTVWFVISHTLIYHSIPVFVKKKQFVFPFFFCEVGSYFLVELANPSSGNPCGSSAPVLDPFWLALANNIFFLKKNEFKCEKKGKKRHKRNGLTAPAVMRRPSGEGHDDDCPARLSQRNWLVNGWSRPTVAPEYTGSD